MKTTQRYVSYITQLRVLTGGTPMGISLFLLVVSGIVFNLVTLDSELMYAGDEWATTQSTLLYKEIIESEDDEGNVSYSYEYTISYIVAGASYSTTCYSNKDIAPKHSLIQLEAYLPAELTNQPAKTYPTEYNTNKPHVARIIGSKSAPYAAWVGVLVSIFALAILFWVIINYRKNSQLLDLLMFGIYTRGKYQSHITTNTSINDSPVVIYKFGFRAQDGKQYSTKGKTHQYHLVEDEETEAILYQANNPKKAIICDIYTYMPKLAQSGELEKQTSFLGLTPLVLLLAISAGIYYLFS